MSLADHVYDFDPDNRLRAFFPKMHGHSGSSSAFHRQSDYPGAKALLSSQSRAKTLIADRGYDVELFCWVLAERGTEPCIPSPSARKILSSHDLALQRQRIENMFERLRIVVWP